MSPFLSKSEKADLITEFEAYSEQTGPTVKLKFDESGRVLYAVHTAFYLGTCDGQLWALYKAHTQLTVGLPIEQAFGCLLTRMRSLKG